MWWQDLSPRSQLHVIIANAFLPLIIMARVIHYFPLVGRNVCSSLPPARNELRL